MAPTGDIFPESHRFFATGCQRLVAGMASHSGITLATSQVVRSLVA
jgi:hypothetical protein